MTAKPVAISLVLRTLGIEPRIDTTEARMAAHDAIYLAQAAGVQLGYFFSWYSRSPYSRQLAQDLYEHAAGRAPGVAIDEHTLARLATLRTLLTPPAAAGLPQVEWLELLTATHYLLAHGHPAHPLEELRDHIERFSQSFLVRQVKLAVATISHCTFPRGRLDSQT